MSSYRGLAIDPGMSNGICEFVWADDAPFMVLRRFQFPGGASALRHAVRALTQEHTYDVLVVEKFTPRQNEGFNLTRDAAEPLRGEGVLIGLGLEGLIQWAEPSQQYFMGGDTLKEKKQRSRSFLKRHGLYATGKAFSQKDADDAISAQLHAIAWLRRQRHAPTITALFGEQE